MENNYQIQVRKMQKLDQTYVAFSQGTRMPFITCDEESFNDQIWVFTTEDKAKEFGEKRRDERKDILMVVRLENQQLLGFYSGLYLLGVNEIVFVEEEQTTKILLEQLVKAPDHSKLPNEKRPLMNPQMQLTGLYFMQELLRAVPNNEKPKLPELEEEMVVNLIRSKFFMPIEVEGETIQPDGSNIKIPCVKTKEDKMFQPIFTDYNEFQKFNKEGKFKANIIEFVNIEKVLGKSVEGVVVNPQGMNTVIAKSMIPNLLNRFAKG